MDPLPNGTLDIEITVTDDETTWRDFPSPPVPTEAGPVTVWKSSPGAPPVGGK
jgi:hypothetical protein